MSEFELTEDQVRYCHPYFMNENLVEEQQEILQRFPNIIELFEQLGLPIPKNYRQGVQLGEVGNDRVIIRPSGFSGLDRDPEPDQSNDRRSCNVFGKSGDLPNDVREQLKEERSQLIIKSSSLLQIKENQKNQTLKSFTLNDVQLTDEGVLSLSIGLQSNTYISEINLPNNQITSYGIENLLDCLETNTNIVDIDLESSLFLNSETNSKLTQAFMRNQTLLILENDDETKLCNGFINLQLIVESNCFIIENIEHLKDYLEDGQNQHHQIQLPKELESYIKQKLELRKSNKPPSILSNSSSASDLLKMRQPFQSISQSHIASQKNLKTSNYNLDEPKSFNSPLQKQEQPIKMLYYPSMSDISGNQENEIPMDIRELQQLRYHDQPSQKTSLDYHTSKNPSLNLSDSKEYINSEEEEETKYQNVGQQQYDNKTQTSSILLNNTENQKQFFEALGQDRANAGHFEHISEAPGHQRQISGYSQNQSFLNTQNLQDSLIKRLEDLIHERLLDSESRLQQSIIQNNEKLNQYYKEQSKLVDLQKQSELRLNQYSDKFEEIQMSLHYIQNQQEDQQKMVGQFQNQLNELKTRPASVDGRKSISNINMNNVKKKDEIELRTKCEQLVAETRSQLKAIQEQTDISAFQKEQQALINHFNQIQQDVNNRLLEFSKSFQEDHQQKHLESSIIQMMEERITSSDERMQGLEKLTKEIHVAIQRYKNKNLEKNIQDRFDQIVQENKQFQDQIKQKLIDINNLIDQKCKKSVANVYESKITKIETDIKLISDSLESKSDDRLRRSQHNSGQNQNMPITQQNVGYAYKNEIQKVIQRQDDQQKILEKVKTDTIDFKQKIQQLFEYFGQIEDKLEELNRHKIQQQQNPFEIEFKSPIKEMNILDMSSPTSDLGISPLRQQIVNQRNQTSSIQVIQQSQSLNPVTVGHSKLSNQVQINSDYSPTIQLKQNINHMGTSQNQVSHNQDRYKQTTLSQKQSQDKQTSERLDSNQILSKSNQPGLYERAFTFSQLNPPNNQPTQMSTGSSKDYGFTTIEKTNRNRMSTISSEPSEELKQNLISKGLYNILSDNKHTR
ncbi:UNKNOWN [Stylonychia lemnae]|uniref:Uncharacterized protein n=1 Tax=Stylonychia lemnae TaxID=5949 RepID=A0A078A7I1_STYLE|nr:UNKNOWN [Stylonychia lemnae]|eukprot:CDW78204.1 UNKNOWN [Stylonychia lemnae]